jgi:hypothetical protein
MLTTTGIFSNHLQLAEWGGGDYTKKKNIYLLLQLMKVLRMPLSALSNTS